MDAYPHEARLRVGRLLAARRGQIDPRYRVRRVFAQERAAKLDLSERLLQDLEAPPVGRNFPPATIAVAERLYELEPGAYEHALAGGDLTPAGPRLSVIETPPTAYPDFVGDDPFLRRLWDDPFAPEDEREAAVRGVIAHREAVRAELARQFEPGKQSERGRA